MEVRIEAIDYDAAKADNGVLCQLTDGRVFVTLLDQIGKYAEPGDADALAAFNRAWTHDPKLFNGPVRPRAPVVQLSRSNGVVGDLTPLDRLRLKLIILKYKDRYFAPDTEPTEYQIDNLIDAFGARAAEKIVKRQVDAGRL